MTLRRRFRKHALHDQQDRVRGDRLSAVAEDGDGAVVVPVVQDRAQHIGVNARRDAVKETAINDLNDQNAHANIVSADATFRVGHTKDIVDLPFFDVEDEYFVKADLWRISSAAITLMDLFYGVTESVARATGRSVLEFRPDFPNTIEGLVAESNALQREIIGSDRYKAAMRKEQQRPRQGEAGR